MSPLKNKSLGIKDPGHRKTLGAMGEELARTYLEDNGYSILMCNYHTSLGEIDLIAEDGDVLVFIEVKTRRSTKYGSPFEAVTKTKQIKISKVALCYLNKNKLHHRIIRFDVVSILAPSNQKPVIELIKDAFEI
jgi:putative endonuclease